MATEIYVMRHGETEANVRQVLSGRGDSPFTELGRRQPLEVARHLDSLTLACIYSSPVARARRTADLVQAALGGSIPVREEPALAEIDAGEFTGLAFEEVRRRVKDYGRMRDFRYPGGESWSDVQARAVAFVGGMEERHPKDAVLLVTHAGVIAGLVAQHLDEPIGRFIRTRFGHDFLGRLRIEDGSIASYEKLTGTVDDWF
jgi:broad specificity phosphatase PhoE